MSNIHRKTPAELQKTLGTKATRAMIRLKYSMLADEELNDALPDFQEEFDSKALSGQPVRLEIGVGGVRLVDPDDNPDA